MSAAECVSISAAAGLCTSVTVLKIYAISAALGQQKAAGLGTTSGVSTLRRQESGVAQYTSAVVCFGTASTAGVGASTAALADAAYICSLNRNRISRFQVVPIK